MAPSLIEGDRGGMGKFSLTRARAADPIEDGYLLPYSKSMSRPTEIGSAVRTFSPGRSR